VCFFLDLVIIALLQTVAARLFINPTQIGKRIQAWIWSGKVNFENGSPMFSVG
jgi:hypothetical protein